MCTSASHSTNFGRSGHGVPVSIQRPRDNIDFHAVPEQLRIYRQIKQAVRINQSINQSINQFISETADSKIEIQDNDNVQPLTEVRIGCCQR